MKLMLSALCVLFALAFASSSQAAVVQTYGDVTVANSPNGPVWDLKSDVAGIGYAGLYLTNPGLAPNDLTSLSALYQMLQGNFGGGSPRFTLFDSLNGAAYIYWGPPPYNSDPNGGVWGSTGNLVGALVDTNGFGGTGYQYQITWASFLAQAGAVNIQYLVLVDLDGGWVATQELIVNNIDVNGTLYNPTLQVADVPEPSALLLLAVGLLASTFFMRGPGRLLRMR